MTLKALPVARPSPDARRFVDHLTGRRRAARVPLVEYIVDETVLRPVVTGLLGRPWAPGGAGREAQAAWLDNFTAFWRGLGYDCVRFEAGLPFPENTTAAPDTGAAAGRARAWADEHAGRIADRAGLEAYPWPRVEDFDFFPFEHLARTLPEGMGLLVSHAGGPFEHLSWIMSLEGLAFALKDDPALVDEVAGRVGRRLEAFYRHLLDLPGIVAVFGGDDMGFRSGTLISPDDLRRCALPWHKRYAAMAHAKGLPYLLHSCGRIDAVMGDLAGDVGIDGKHSFEDAIRPAEDFQREWGDRLATLGGVDLNVLAGGTPDDVRRRTRELVERCGPRGRFAVGSGNSIPSYVPAESYLAMVDEALIAG